MKQYQTFRNRNGLDRNYRHPVLLLSYKYIDKSDKKKTYNGGLPCRIIKILSVIMIKYVKYIRFLAIEIRHSYFAIANLHVACHFISSYEYENSLLRNDAYFWKKKSHVRNGIRNRTAEVEIQYSNH